MISIVYWEIDNSKPFSHFPPPPLFQLTLPQLISSNHDKARKRSNPLKI